MNTFHYLSMLLLTFTYIAFIFVGLIVLYASLRNPRTFVEELWDGMWGGDVKSPWLFIVFFYWFGILTYWIVFDNC